MIIFLARVLLRNTGRSYKCLVSTHRVRHISGDLCREQTWMSKRGLVQIPVEEAQRLYLFSTAREAGLDLLNHLQPNRDPKIGLGAYVQRTLPPNSP